MQRSAYLWLGRFILSSIATSRAFLALGQTAETPLWLTKVGSFNDLPQAAGAGSLGSEGVRLNLSLTKRNHLDGPTKAEMSNNSYRETTPEVALATGSPLPITIGLAAAYLGHQQYSAAYMGQWTFYEEFARPALAVRYSGAKVFGFEGTEVQRHSMALLASYGWRWFTIEGLLGIQHNHYQYAPSAPSDTKLDLWKSIERQPVNLRNYELTKAWRFQVTIFPPVWSLGVHVEEKTYGRAVSAMIGINL